MYNFRKILREGAPSEPGSGSGNEPVYNIPDNVNAIFGRLGIEDASTIDPDKFLDQVSESEYGKNYFQSKQPKPDSSEFLKAFENDWDLEGIETPADLSKMFLDMVPDEDEQAPDNSELADKYRALELERDQLAEQTGTFEGQLKNARDAAKFEAMTEYKISESILKNDALTETGRANVQLVKSGVLQNLKAQGIELRPGQDGKIELVKGDMPVFVQGSKERQTVGNLVNEYLSKNKWLSESPATGGGNLSQKAVSNQKQQPAGPRQPTAMLWTGFN